MRLLCLELQKRKKDPRQMSKTNETLRDKIDETLHVTSLTLDLKKVAHNLRRIREKMGSDGVIAVVKGFG